MSPSGAVFEFSNRLEEYCTNNQVEYEALLFGLEILQSMGVKHAKVFGDLLLVVQQVSNVCQCYNGSLNAYLDKCLEIISSFDEFIIRHLPREENGQANALAQQASGYNVRKGKFNIRRPMQMIAELQFLDEPVKPVDATGLTCPETGLNDQIAENTDSVMKKAKDQDWRVPMIFYLKDPGCGAESNIRRAAFKYVLIDN